MLVALSALAAGLIVAAAAGTSRRGPVLVPLRVRSRRVRRIVRR